MKMLFLDDERMPIQCMKWMALREPQLYEIYATMGWNIVRSYGEFCKWIEENGVPDLISFDHDLADEHYRNSMYNPDKHYSNYYTDGTFKEKTGYDCAKWLKEYCDSNGINYPRIMVHSMNPIGSTNIYSVFYYEETS